MNQTKKRTQQTKIWIQQEGLVIMNQKDPFILYKFDDLQSRNSNLKLVENLKKHLKRDSNTIKK